MSIAVPTATLLEPVRAAAAAAALESSAAPTAFDIDRATTQLASALAATAIERDREGGHAAHERELVRESGLLALTIPRAFGGHGADWPTLFSVVRRLAQADSALAHVFGFHHLQIASLLLYGNAEQQGRLLRQTTAERLFWGNAMNPRDPGLKATRVDGGWRLDGRKSFTSGSLGSDRLTFSALVAGAAPPAAGTSPDSAPPLQLIGQVATRSAGLRVNEDWDGFGQRQTDSGSVEFDQVHLDERDVLVAPGVVLSPHASSRTLVSQLIMSSLYLGIAEGAFESARRYTLESARAWPASGVTRSADDPYVQQRYGNLWLQLRSAQLALDAAALRLQASLERGLRLTAAERGETAAIVAEAKVLSHRAGVEVSAQIFELTGARSTSSRLGLDRFWRNARVHTLHDPVDYKLRDIGRFRLEGRVPEANPYA